MHSVFFFCLFVFPNHKTRNALEPQRLHGCVPSSCWSCMFSSPLFFPPETVLCTSLTTQGTLYIYYFTLLFYGPPLASTYRERTANVPLQHCCYPTKDSQGSLQASCSAVFQCLGLTCSQSQCPGKSCAFVYCSRATTKLTLVTTPAKGVPATSSRLQQAAHSSTAAFLTCNDNNQTRVDRGIAYAILTKMPRSAVYMSHAHALCSFPCHGGAVFLLHNLNSYKESLANEESIHSTYTPRHKGSI